MATTSTGRIAAVTLTILLLSSAGCGEPSVLGSDPTPTGAPVSTAADPSTPTTASTTTTTAPEPGVRDDGTPLALPALGADAPDGLASAAAVPWDDVGPGWLLVLAGGWPDPGHLVLVDPADTAYGLGGWGDAWQLLDWDGARILYLDDDGVTILDLATGAVESGFTNDGVDDVQWLSASLAGPGGNAVIGTIGSTEPARAAIEIRTPGMDVAATLVDRPYDPQGPWPTWSPHPDGSAIAVVDGDRFSLYDTGGTETGAFPLPGVSCRVARWWSEDAVLVSCVDPDYARSDTAACWPGSGSRLWVVPVDGSAPEPLTPAVGPGGDGCDGYEPEYDDALDLGGLLLVATGGCCDCGGDLVAFTPDGGVVSPADNDTLMALECSPGLIALRDGHAIVRAIDLQPDRLEEGLFEIDGSLNHRRLLGDMTVRFALAYPSPASP